MLYKYLPAGCATQHKISGLLTTKREQRIDGVPETRVLQVDTRLSMRLLSMSFFREETRKAIKKWKYHSQFVWNTRDSAIFPVAKWCPAAMASAVPSLAAMTSILWARFVAHPALSIAFALPGNLHNLQPQIGMNIHRLYS